MLYLFQVQQKGFEILCMQIYTIVLEEQFICCCLFWFF